MTELKKLKSNAIVMKPSVQIGKKGLTKESIDEIKKQLKKNGIVKVKFLRAALENTNKKKLALVIASKTDSSLISFIGFAAVYHKPIKPAKII